MLELESSIYYAKVIKDNPNPDDLENLKQLTFLSSHPQDKSESGRQLSMDSLMNYTKNFQCSAMLNWFPSLDHDRMRCRSRSCSQNLPEFRRSMYMAPNLALEKQRRSGKYTIPTNRLVTILMLSFGLLLFDFQYWSCRVPLLLKSI